MMKIIDTYKRVFMLILTVLLLNTCIIKISFIPTSSMEEEVPKGSIVISLRLSTPERGDVVIVSREKIELIKRIVACEDDEVTFKDGKVLIGSKEINEEYVKGKTYCTESFTVPQNKYFVLGDNREESYDSRFFKNPYIDASEIKAVAKIVIPLSQINRTHLILKKGTI